MKLLRPLTAASSLLLACGLAQHALGQAASPIERDRLDREAQPPTTEEPHPAPHGVTSTTSVETRAAPAADIRRIDFVGAEVPLVVARAAQKFVGQKATKENLQGLASAMSAAYARSPVALFTVVIPDQDLSSGNIKVLVGEGFIETVVLKGEVKGHSLSLVKAYAEKLRTQRPLSRARFERYLSLIRDIPALKVTTALKLGKTKGGVILEITLDYDKPTLAFSYDSRASSLINDGQIEAHAILPHLLREGDSTEIVGIVSPDFKSLRYIGIGHSTPLDSDGTRLAINYSHLDTELKDVDLKGSADTGGVTLSHPFVRNFHSRLTGTISADLIDTHNSAFGSLIANEKVRSARGGLSFSTWNARRVLSTSLVVSKGLGVLGASVDPASGKERYLKLSGNAAWFQQVGKRFVVRLQGAGQYTGDPLPVSERFSVGGATFGRAFEQGLIVADRGLAGSAELAVRPLAKGDFARSEIYGFVDYAAVRYLDRPGFTHTDVNLGSAGFGVRAAWKEKAMLGLEAAKVVDRPYPAYQGDWRFTVSWRLALRP